tara:strand:+ start:112 stop:1545 length:1434 start_codon:yes stop_codon:yes gene_type:complete
VISDTVRFIFNNKICELKNPDPNQTILNFLRSNLKKTGTKEGCAEGGCGACTIVLGELNNNDVNYKAVNACIAFVPILEGKQLLVVEDLVNENGDLHPVQKLMVNNHGSQCGFCTPGFVMSLFSMYKNNNSYSVDLIKDSISGNLCRCTGYRPIIDAAKKLNLSNRKDQFFKNKKKIITLLKKIKNNSLEIKSENKNYFAPKTLNELKKLIKKNPKSNLLSGGTDLSLKVTKERKDIKSIIYLQSVKELDFIRIKKNQINVGASTPIIKFEKYIKKYYPDFNSILKRYGSVQIRNVGTIAGNIATASPIGDTLPLLLSLDAKIVLDGIKKIEISLNDFFIGYRKTKLKKGQFIYSIKIPIYKKNVFKAYKVSKRFDDDISSVCGSFNIELKKNIIKKVKIAYGGMSEIPKRAITTEKILNNSNFSELNFYKAIKNLEKDYKPIDDMRASKEYRMEVAKNLLMKCYLEVKNNKLMRLS